VIPKSTNIKRMEENRNIFDFTLSDNEMEILRSLNLNDKGTRSYTDVEYARRIIAQVF
jgi:diketogulonate reductase-like aldo/keto reductase